MIKSVVNRIFVSLEIFMNVVTKNYLNYFVNYIILICFEIIKSFDRDGLCSLLTYYFIQQFNNIVQFLE